jgi:nickel-dependent lactate racemase
MYFTEIKDKNVIYYDIKEKVKIAIDEEKFLGLINIEEPEELRWPEEFQDSFEKPINSKLLRDLAKGANRVAIIVSDSTRGVPTSKIMPIVLKELQTAGVNFKQIVVVIALGVHRPATPREIEEEAGLPRKDLEVIKAVGFGCTVNDGMECVKEAADYVTKVDGGKGAVREVVELILESRGNIN